MRLLRPLLAASLLAAASLDAGCYSGPTAHAVSAGVYAQGRVTITVREIDGNIFKLTVLNLSKEPMLVDRDAFVLVTPTGRYKRVSGGVANAYTIAPGARHEVNLKFALDYEPGTKVEIDPASAVLVGGRPVSLEPIPFVVE